MRIALLTDGIYPFELGGMQKHSHYLAHFLSKAGHALTLAHSISGTTELPSDAEVRKALKIGDDADFEQRVFRFPKGDGLPGHYLRSSYAYSIQVFRSLQKELNSYDLIYAKGFSAWELLNRKRKGLACPPIAVKFHGYEMYQNIPGWKAKLGRHLLRGPVAFNNRHADYVFSYGGKITTLIQHLGVPSERIIEIPTGIAASWCLDAPKEVQSDERRFVFVGRFERRKGIEELHAAFASLPAEVKAHLDLIGPIPHSKRVADERLSYHGTLKSIEELQAVLDAAEVLITPSYAEGMPNVIMEGMARGLAVIATDVGAVSAQVDEHCGWLIPAADQKALEEAILTAAKLPRSEIVRMQAAALKKVRSHFTWEEVAKQTLNAFESIVAEQHA